MPDRPRYRLTLEDVWYPQGPPPAVRLRRLLKTLLRAYGFRASWVAAGREEEPERKEGDRER